MEKLSLSTQIFNLKFDKSETKPKKDINNFESYLGNKKKDYIDNSKPEKNIKTKSSKEKNIVNIQKEKTNETNEISQEPVSEVKKIKVNEKEKPKTEENVLEEISIEFNISVEELKVKLDELGIKLEDLFSGDNLNKLVSMIIEVEPEELISDSTLMEKFNSIKSNIKDIIENNKDVFSNNSEKNIEVSEVVEEIIDTDSDDEPQEQQQSDNQLIDNTKIGNNIKSNTFNNNANQEFANALNDVVTTTKDTIVMNGKIATVTKTVTSADVFNQIVKGVKVQVTDKLANMTLKLHPENLGKLNLSLTSQDGSITGHFIAETEAVRQVIESNLAILRNQLESQGINVDELLVTVQKENSFDLEQESTNDFTGKNSKKNRKNLIIENDFEVEEEENRNININGENSIELKA